jgi:hypothetical protein
MNDVGTYSNIGSYLIEYWKYPYEGSHIYKNGLNTEVNGLTTSYDSDMKERRRLRQDFSSFPSSLQ